MRRLAIAVGLLSGAALAYEILLIRLFSIVDWHHLAFLVISLALLGYGSSGTLLALARERLLRHVPFVTATAAALFGATSVGAFLLSQRIDFNSLEIFWSTRQLGTLFVLYLLFAVPFFCAATAIGLTLTRYGEQSPRIYRADLVGGGLASAAIIALLFYVHPATALQCIGAAGFVAAFLFHQRAIFIAVAGVAIVAFARPLPLRISQFKELSHALRVPGARVVEERTSPLGLLTVVESPNVPFRHAPGLSLAWSGELPEQRAIFTDGGGFTAVTIGSERSHFDFMPQAAPYVARAFARAGGRAEARPTSVLVIGAGGGDEVLSALHHGATRVTAVELNPQMIALARGYPGARVVRSEARRFIRETNERFDVIQITLVDSFGASAAGVGARSESYLYTVEALGEMRERLAPGGFLAITRWMQTPPRDILKLFATAARHTNQLAIVRSWNTATLLVKNGDFTASELAALRRFCDERSFDLDYAPGITRAETNQYNVLDDSYLFDAATKRDFAERYKFNVRPATDDRPYFFHFFRWSALRELLELRKRGGMQLLEWGYLVLIAGLAQAIVGGVLLIVAPLLWLRRGLRTPATKLILYFGSIGLGFLFIEIAFMQRLTLLLGHPLYAVALVLASFLFFAGIGSGVSARLPESKRIAMYVAIAAVIALVLVRLVPGPAAALVIAPLAFLMGMPFPHGLRRLAARDPAAIPWAWGINGMASVVASMCATLIAVHFGFSALVLVAALLYVVAGMV